MSKFSTCEIQPVRKETLHPDENEFNFQPKFRWEGVVTEISDSTVFGKVYDEYNDLTSEVEISSEIIANHQLYYLEEGTLFNLYSGINKKTNKEELLFELRKEPFHIVSFDDLIDMYSNLDISKNII